MPSMLGLDAASVRTRISRRPIERLQALQQDARLARPPSGCNAGISCRCELSVRSCSWLSCAVSWATRSAGCRRGPGFAAGVSWPTRLGQRAQLVVPLRSTSVAAGFSWPIASGNAAQLVVSLRYRLCSRAQLRPMADRPQRASSGARAGCREDQGLQLAELADRLGQRAQLVAAETQVLQLAQLADRLGQRAQLVVPDVRICSSACSSQLQLELCRSPRATRSAGCR